MTTQCGAMCGPIWKLGGETCVCIEADGHVDREDGQFGADHRCSCGAWFVDSVARHPPSPPRGAESRTAWEHGEPADTCGGCETDADEDDEV